MIIYISFCISLLIFIFWFTPHTSLQSLSALSLFMIAVWWTHGVYSSVWLFFHCSGSTRSGWQTCEYSRVCVCVCVWKTDSGFSHYWTFIYLICLSKVVCEFLSGIWLSNGLSFWTNLLTEAASKLMLLSFDYIRLLLLIFIAHKH